VKLKKNSKIGRFSAQEKVFSFLMSPKKLKSDQNWLRILPMRFLCASSTTLLNGHRGRADDKNQLGKCKDTKVKDRRTAAILNLRLVRR